MDLVCTCKCGRQVKVSEFAIGMTSRCAQCDRALKVTLENTVPAGEDSGGSDAPQRNKPIEVVATTPSERKGVGGPQVCARCKRPFKGEWDRYWRPEGMVCHVCANLAVHYTPEAPVLKPTPVAPTELPPDPASVQPVAQEVRRGGLLDQFDEFKESRGFRIGLWAAALGVIALGIVCSRTEETAPTVSESDAAVRGSGGLGVFGPPEELSESQQTAIVVIVSVLRVVLVWMPSFMALYVMLHMAGRLPCYNVWANVLHTGVASLLIALFAVAVSLVANFVPMGGRLFFVAGWGVILYLIYEMYDLRLGDIGMFLAVLLVSRFAIVPLQQLIYGAVGLLLLEQPA